MKIQGFIEVDNARLEYHWIAGRPDAPVLALLHEGLGCVSMWKSFPQRLAEKTGLGVFSYSRQGYGLSDCCVLPRAVAYMHDEAEVLGKVLTHIPGEAFILVGHSDGASIATIFAGSHAESPTLALVLIAPHFFVEPKTIESIAAAKLLYKTTDLRTRLGRYHGAQVDQTFWGWNDAWLCDEFRSWNITEYLPNIEIPTLVIQGASDEYGSTAQVTAAEQEINGSVQTCLLPGCGHSPYRQFEGETVRAIAGFIETGL
ncbi:MAG: alpha/beta hydrolase [Gammaproteobacteria bacterium]|nr:alpha/beta hydrolase [Gammaproteobacteria bacterium]